MPSAASIVLLLAFFVQLAGSGSASDFAGSRASLRGLGGVYVAVEEIDDELEEAGLKRLELETEIEARIRRAGIPVLNKRDFHESATAGLLYITVNTTREASNGMAATVDVSLKQRVSLQRAPAVQTLAETWSSEELALLERPKAVRYIRGAVNEHLDRFIRAYRSVNPK